MPPAKVGVSLGAAVGTAPPSAVANPVNNDDRGTFTFGTGTTPVAGALCTILLGGNYSSGIDGSGLLVPTVVPLNQATYNLGVYVSSYSARLVVVSCTNAPAASQGNTTYALAYRT